MGKKYRISIITASDKCSKGLREDRSGSYIKQFFEKEGWQIISYEIIPDEMEKIYSAITDICDNQKSDLILTTGGTGFSVRDITPEATRKALEREAPGFSELIRSYGQLKTPRAILSRAVSGIRKKTIIINLPGSIKGVKDGLECIFKPVVHAIDILTGKDSECGEEN